MNSIPVYRSYKTVRAFKIAEIRFPDGAAELPPVMFPVMAGRILIAAEPGIEPVSVDANYVLRHEPQIGGYYVVYGDGYQSFSPAGAFEGGYIRIGPTSPPAAPEQRVSNALRPGESIEIGELARRAGLEVDTVRRVIDAMNPEVRTNG